MDHGSIHNLIPNNREGTFARVSTQISNGESAEEEENDARTSVYTTLSNLSKKTSIQAKPTIVLHIPKPPPIQVEYKVPDMVKAAKDKMESNDPVTANSDEDEAWERVFDKMRTEKRQFFIWTRNLEECI